MHHPLTPRIAFPAKPDLLEISDDEERGIRDMWRPSHTPSHAPWGCITSVWVDGHGTPPHKLTFVKTDHILKRRIVALTFTIGTCDTRVNLAIAKQPQRDIPLMESFKSVFHEPPGTNLAGIPVQGLHLPSPNVSYGLPYDVACAKHVKETFNASRVYVIASGSLSRNTDRVTKLIEALGRDRVVGLRKGVAPHSLWSEILQVAAECRETEADCVVTLGAGSTTDLAKIVVLVWTLSTVVIKQND